MANLGRVAPAPRPPDSKHPNVSDALCVKSGSGARLEAARINIVFNGPLQGNRGCVLKSRGGWRSSRAFHGYPISRPDVNTVALSVVLEVMKWLSSRNLHLQYPDEVSLTAQQFDCAMISAFSSLKSEKDSLMKFTKMHTSHLALILDVADLDLVLAGLGNPTQEILEKLEVGLCVARVMLSCGVISGRNLNSQKSFRSCSHVGLLTYMLSCGRNLRHESGPA